MRAVITIGIVLLLATPIHAVEPPRGTVFRAEVALKVPKKAKDKRAGETGTAPFALFIPEGVKSVKGIVFNPFHEKTVEQKHWRTAVEHWDFALMGANLFGVRKGDLREVVLDGQAALATASGQPEIAHAPLCVVGMSAGGGMSASLAEVMPERIIAAAPVCLEVGPRTPESRRVPMLTIFGERDGKQLEKLSAKLPAQRAQGAQWAIAIQWGRRHEFAKANNLIIPFFDQVIRVRCSDDAPLRSGPVSLKPYPEAGTVLGEKDSWGEGLAPLRAADARTEGFDPTRACWFPDWRSAMLWQGFVTKNPQLKIDDPPGLGDGQPFRLHPAGKEVVVRITSKPESGIRTILLYDGAEKIAETGAGGGALRTPPLEAGIHPLLAVGVDAEGERHFAMPHTILVR